MKKEIIIMSVTFSLIFLNGILAITGVYPLWIGYFNYLFACIPLIRLLITKA
jgi:hypothetical protein